MLGRFIYIRQSTSSQSSSSSVFSLSQPLVENDRYCLHNSITNNSNINPTNTNPTTTTTSSIPLNSNNNNNNISNSDEDAAITALESSLSGLSNLMILMIRPIIWISCIFITFLCWDISGDSIGWERSLWVPFVTFTFLTLLWLGYSKLSYQWKSLEFISKLFIQDVFCH